MKILLCNPRFSHPNGNFPLGLAYLGAVLLEAGHQVESFDVNAHGWTDEEIKQRLRDGDWDVFCLGGMITHYVFHRWLAKTIREVHPDAKIVLGGPLGTAVPEHLLRSTDVDVVCIGEGEETIVELVEHFAQQSDFSEVHGICYRNGSANEAKRRLMPAEGEPMRTPERRRMSELDALPLPAWDLFPMEHYLHGSKASLNAGIRSLNVIATRGCPYSCAFCGKDLMWGRKVMVRSPRNVVDEILELKRRYNIQAAVFSDEQLTANRRWLSEFCELMIAEGQGVRWTCNSRVDTAPEKLLQMMADAGCVVVAYGIESGSQSVLESMHKKINLEQSERSIQAARDNGIEVLPYLAVGMPNETPESIAETVDFCRRNGLYAEISVITPLPGSPLFDWSVENGKVTSIEDLLEGWRTFQSGITVNLTNMSDDELWEHKVSAERAILFNYMLNGRQFVRRARNLQRAFGSGPVLEMLRQIPLQIQHRLRS